MELGLHLKSVLEISISNLLQALNLRVVAVGEPKSREIGSLINTPEIYLIHWCKSIVFLP